MINTSIPEYRQSDRNFLCFMLKSNEFISRNQVKIFRTPFQLRVTAKVTEPLLDQLVPSHTAQKILQRCDNVVRTLYLQPYNVVTTYFATFWQRSDNVVTTLSQRCINISDNKCFNLSKSYYK